MAEVREARGHRESVGCICGAVQGRRSGFFWQRRSRGTDQGVDRQGPEGAGAEELAGHTLEGRLRARRAEGRHVRRHARRSGPLDGRGPPRRDLLQRQPGGTAAHLQVFGQRRPYRLPFCLLRSHLCDGTEAGGLGVCSDRSLLGHPAVGGPLLHRHLGRGEGGEKGRLEGDAALASGQCAASSRPRLPDCQQPVGLRDLKLRRTTDRPVGLCRAAQPIHQEPNP
mmetsp:Transcript_73838/g.208117  ORF Transcript_73838/g.208117 Transcript_73838/m.208117 type:complete len:225 (-) Transcript_73838:26-700(-)